MNSPSEGRMPGRGQVGPYFRAELALSEIFLYGQPAGPNPLFHRHDLVDRPRAMGV